MVRFWFLTGLPAGFLPWFLARPLVPGPLGPDEQLRPCGASLRPKLLAAWPRWSEWMWKMCLRVAGYVVYARRKDCSAVTSQGHAGQSKRSTHTPLTGGRGHGIDVPFLAACRDAALECTKFSNSVWRTVARSRTSCSRALDEL